MRTSTSILFLACLVFGTGALASNSMADSFEAIIARHENDLYLESRGLMTEFEARAILIARSKPNGDCTGSPSSENASACSTASGTGWKHDGHCYGKQQMILQGTQSKGECYNTQRLVTRTKPMPGGGGKGKPPQPPKYTEKPVVKKDKKFKHHQSD
ncbi:hypothetical protein B0H34DRAFT_674493 [Crassisporium funariophilum]|nr:hypothetical protein B0H34DRAFT_674493 [Crassisporium funariophilum]